MYILSIPFIIKIIDIVSSIITNVMAFVVHSLFQLPLFSFHLNSSQSQQLNSIVFICHVIVLRQPHFQVSNQNNQTEEVTWFDW